jgi:hypothetical protein
MNYKKFRLESHKIVDKLGIGAFKSINYQKTIIFVNKKPRLLIEGWVAAMKLNPAVSYSPTQLVAQARGLRYQYHRPCSA